MKRCIDIEDLSINITNLCNMDCYFCLRDGSREGRLDLALIPKIFEGITSVRNLTITGGEPSRYPEAVKAITDYLVEHKDDIDINGLFIATNGKEYCQELVDAVKTVLYLYMEKQYRDSHMDYDGCGFIKNTLEDVKYQFCIAVSVDEYHDPIETMNYIKYLTSGVYSSVKEQDRPRRQVIDRGRGAGIYGSIYHPYQEFQAKYTDDVIAVPSVYITTDGNVFADCDMSPDMEAACVPAGMLETETLAEIIVRKAEGSASYEE